MTRHTNSGNTRSCRTRSGQLKPGHIRECNKSDRPADTKGLITGNFNTSYLIPSLIKDRQINTGHANAKSLMLVVLSLLAIVMCNNKATAEPYLAAKTGYKCMVCHVSPTGGGMRTAFGATYGQTAMSARFSGQLWDGTLTKNFSVGGDLRANALMRDIPEQESSAVFETEEMLVYGHFSLLKDKLSFYFDQRIGPGGSSNREAYALLFFANKDYYVRAGRMFLPFGWRLEDDSAFIRQVPGINYNTPDDGVEIGRESDHWSINLALTNGSAGAGDTDSGKQWSLRAVHVQPKWRIGTSANFNDVGSTSRGMYNLFGSLKTGKVAWLFELDYIDDEGFSPEPRQQWIGFGEANVELAKGYNLKLSYEYFDPDNQIDEDDANRASVVLEAFPMQFLQLSLGARFGDGIPQNIQFNTNEYFFQLHAYF